MRNWLRVLAIGLVVGFTVLLPETGQADNQPVDVAARSCPRPVASPLPTILCLYRSEFNLPLRAPSVAPQRCVYFVEWTGFPSPPCTPGWTATAYIGGRVYRIYLSKDGRFSTDAHPAQRPLGTFRTLTVGIDYGTLNIQSALSNYWTASVERINASHAAFALSNSYPAPLVQFVDRAVLVPRSAFAPDTVTRETVLAYLQNQGISASEYNVVIALDLDPAHGAGGYAGYGSDFVYMGWYWGDSQPIDQYRSDCIAASVFHHEIAHIWGWEHLWTAEETNVATASCGDVFITDPVLFGWTDTDGDQLPEIADPNPYGLFSLRLPGVASDR